MNIVSLSYTSVPRPNLIFEIRGGYNRFLQQFVPQDIGLNPDTAFGLNTLPPDYFASHDLRLAHYRRPGRLQPDRLNRQATRAAASTPTTSSSATSRCIKGRHSFKAGYEWRRTFINSFIDSGHRGKLVFDISGRFPLRHDRRRQFRRGDGTRYSYQNGGGAYFLDSWRMTPRITVNYGLRWDYFGVIGAKNNAFSIFNVKTGGLQTGRRRGAPQLAISQGLARLGSPPELADDLLGNGKLVIRTGIGMFYDGASQDFFVGNQAYNTNAGEAGPGLQHHWLRFSGRLHRHGGRARFSATTRRAACSLSTRA